MRVIFLDIDGVLNCRRTSNPRKFPYIIDRKLLTRSKRLLKRTGARVVLTSSWRFDPIGRLAAKHFRIPCIGWLPDLPGRSRGDEIRRWLTNHRNVRRFVVIDDEDDELDGLPLFQPSAEDGLSPVIVRAVSDYFAGRRKKDMRRNVIVRLLQKAEAAIEGHND